MAFDSPSRIVVTDYALKNIDEIVRYYKSISDKVAADFLIELDAAFENISKTPHFQILFDHYRVVKIRRFPYVIIYRYYENQNTAKIIILFNTWKDPQRLSDLEKYLKD